MSSKVHGSPTVLGVIVARGGSKGLPGKNTMPLAGKPLISYTIEAVKQSRLTTGWLVSTDDDEIANVSREYGASVPFKRPEELAKDNVMIYVSLRHACEWVQENEGWTPDYVMGLQATSPLRTTEDIDKAITIAGENDADAVIGYALARQNPYWMKMVADDGRIVDFLPPNSEYLQRQNLPPIYHVCGSMYLAKRELLFKQDSLYTDRTYALVVPQERAIDIDSIEDIRAAERKLQERTVKAIG